VFCSNAYKFVLVLWLIDALSTHATGFFMLSPKPGEIDNLRKVVARQQQRAKDLPIPFDEEHGWGHAIRKPDSWWTINKVHHRRRWKFVGSHAGSYFLARCCRI
jgi:hypothetical protein